MTPPALDLPGNSGIEADDAKEHLRQVVAKHRRAHHRHPEHGHSPQCEALTAHALEAVEGCAAVAAYVSVGHEPCTRLLLERLEQHGTSVLLPVLGPRLSRSWAWFHGVADLAERAPGRPPEPGGEVLPAEAVAEVEALIIPALAVDRSGQRLGKGGGWYDRMIPLRSQGVRTFAMVNADELVDGPLPVEEHDELVDAVITPEQWFLLEGSAFSLKAEDKS